MLLWNFFLDSYEGYKTFNFIICWMNISVFYGLVALTFSSWFVVVSNIVLVDED